MTPRVTDHAVLRFMERAQGFDIEAIRAHIGKTCADAVASGASTLHAQGVKFEIDQRTKTVVTVAPVGRFASRTRRERCGQGMLPARLAPADMPSMEGEV